MKKILFTFLAILFSLAIAKGQHNLILNFVDNSKVTTALDHIQRITFDSDHLLLKTLTGTENSYIIDNIASITFFNDVGIKQFNESIDVNVFVNGSGEIVVETSHQINQLTVFDITGKQVVAGTQNKLNVNFLNTGIYILQVTTDKGLVSKKFIKNR